MKQIYERKNLWQVEPREEVRACRKYFGFLIDKYGFTLNQVSVNYDYYDGYEQVIIEFLKPGAKAEIYYDNLFTRDYSYDVGMKIEWEDGRTSENAAWITLATESERREMNEQANPKRRGQIIGYKFEKLARHIQENAERYLGSK